ANPMSELSVNIALKLGEREHKLKKSTENKSCTDTPEDVKTMGQTLGRIILSSRSEIEQNMDQLEEPSSYKNYSEAIPSPLRNFFEELFKALFERRLAV